MVFSESAPIAMRDRRCLMLPHAVKVRCDTYGHPQTSTYGLKTVALVTLTIYGMESQPTFPRLELLCVPQFSYRSHRTREQLVQPAASLQYDVGVAPLLQGRQSMLALTLRHLHMEEREL